MAEKATKSNSAIKQAVISVAVLVIICLVCVLLLALCNDLLYVSDDEKLSRAMQKIYPSYGGGDKAFNDANKNFTPVTYQGMGTITDVKKAEDGAYVISAKGIGGYKGTITVYVVVKEETVSGGQKDVIIKAWTIKEHDGETFLGNITATHQSTWYVGKSVKDYDQPIFDVDNNKVAKTTYSSTAINNAVKAACYFCIDGQSGLGIASTPESEANDAVLQLLGADYADYTFTAVKDEDFLELGKAGEQELSFFFVGTADGKDELSAYVWGEDENRQIVVLNENVSRSDRLSGDAVVAKSEGIDDALVTSAQNANYADYQIKPYYDDFEFDGYATLNSQYASNGGNSVNKVYNSTDGAVVIQATGTGGYNGGSVTVNVVIADGEIKAWWVVSHVNQTWLNNILAEWDNKVKNWYIGASIENDIAFDESNKFATVTMASRAINNAVNMACYYARSVA